MGVDFGQGYALGEPEPLKEQLAVLKDKKKVEATVSSLTPQS
jgi:EAL domain-containing protein (putative c-di-GMP-specific phosphodiesterase class I)